MMFFKNSICEALGTQVKDCRFRVRFPLWQCRLYSWKRYLGLISEVPIYSSFVSKRGLPCFSLAQVNYANRRAVAKNPNGCCCILCLSSCLPTASDAYYWTIRTLSIALTALCFEESVPA